MTNSPQKNKYVVKVLCNLFELMNHLVFVIHIKYVAKKIRKLY